MKIDSEILRRWADTKPGVMAWRNDFPILRQEVHGKPLVYLDNAATTQKPQAVIDAESEYYRCINANVHRGVHALSQRATDDFEAARNKVRHFMNAAHSEEIIFVRGTTEAINLVAQSYARPRLQPGDEILISAMEHHSNIVPWQMVCEQTGATLKVVPIDDAGEFMFDAYAHLLNARTKLVAVTHLSNALGTIAPVERIIELAHAHDVPVLLDGAQAISHLRVDVRQLDCDFYAFSGHKIFGPTGIGALYGKAALLNAMPPYQGGGDMIRVVTFEKTQYNDLPYKFEAGTPNIAGAIGLGAWRSIMSRPSASMRLPRMRARCSLMRRILFPTYRACASSALRPTRPAFCHSRSTASIRTTSARFWTAPASRSAPVITARCR